MTHALIIDDDVQNLGVLQQFLELQSVSYTSVQDATSVSDLLPTIDQIHVVFLDLEMPEINGYEMLDILKADPKLSGVPIIAHSVYTTEMSSARDAGFDGFISKPLNVNRFPDQLVRVLQGVSVWDSR